MNLARRISTILLALQLAGFGRAMTWPSSVSAEAQTPLHADGSTLEDGNGQVIHLTGVNWFGFETDSFAPHGLWARNYDDMLAEIAAIGFNTLRLPYTNQLFRDGSTPRGIDYQKNPDLEGLSGLALMDRIVDAAGKHGLRVILDRHRPTAAGQSELWYTSEVPESQWIQDWVMLAQHYQGNLTVVGADLHNEPHGAATWGDDNPRTDWRLAAERAGNAILAANPDWLILVEGVERYGNDWYWWGGNLEGAEQAPVRLSEPSKLVYSTHDYGPGVYRQRWFSAPDFPGNLPAVWDQHWAYLSRTGVAPVLVGEFGGRSVGTDREGTWQQALLSFLRDTDLSYTYWSWNPDSGDTGGILQDDWSTLNAQKVAMLSQYDSAHGDGAFARVSGDGASPTVSGDGASATQPQAPGNATPPAGVPQPPPGALMAAGGPFDPDVQHVLAGIGSTSDPDPAHRQARQHDEQLYLQEFGTPWQYAVYTSDGH